jgi:hypothetical protein
MLELLESLPRPFAMWMLHLVTYTLQNSFSFTHSSSHPRTTATIEEPSAPVPDRMQVAATMRVLVVAAAATATTVDEGEAVVVVVGEVDGTTAVDEEATVEEEAEDGSIRIEEDVEVATDKSKHAVGISHISHIGFN